jgi:hypothetical protein
MEREMGQEVYICMDHDDWKRAVNDSQEGKERLREKLSR